MVQIFMPRYIIYFELKSLLLRQIKEMFLQLMVRKQDCATQRFLNRKIERNRELDIYKLQVVFLGSKNSYLVQEVNNRNAHTAMKEHREATKAAIEQHYMEDYLGVTSNEDEAKRLNFNVIHVYGKVNSSFASELILESF